MAEAGAREIRLDHVFDAPREAVFAAWIDPDQVARWWAPGGFEVPRETVEIEPRVGGAFRLTMVQSGGGARLSLRSEFVEITPPELIVLRFEPVAEEIPDVTITRVVFEADGERTRMTLTSGPYTDEMRPTAAAGWGESLANLDRLLAS
jgi:uncharacterized protein YndB with AHSA1/START domain